MSDHGTLFGVAMGIGIGYAAAGVDGALEWLVIVAMVGVAIAADSKRW